MTQLQTALEQQSALLYRLLARIDPAAAAPTTCNRKHPHANGFGIEHAVNGRPRGATSTLWDATEDEDASEGSTGIEQMVSARSPAPAGMNGTGAGRKGKGKADVRS